MGSCASVLARQWSVGRRGVIATTVEYCQEY